MFVKEILFPPKWCFINLFVTCCHLSSSHLSFLSGIYPMFKIKIVFSLKGNKQELLNFPPIVCHIFTSLYLLRSYFLTENFAHTEAESGRWCLFTCCHGPLQSMCARASVCMGVLYISVEVVGDSFFLSPSGYQIPTTQMHGWEHGWSVLSTPSLLPYFVEILSVSSSFSFLAFLQFSDLTRILFRSPTSAAKPRMPYKFQRLFLL